MTIKGKVHCFFEQSGTFKRAFAEFGIAAEDYDIQNNFGETDHVVDLFAEIEKTYEGRGGSVFDNITTDDLILAFFPCIRFCSVMEQAQHEDFYDAGQRRAKDFGTPEYYRRKWKTLRKFSQERFKLYDLALMMFANCQTKGVRLIMENPWHPMNFTNHFWFARVSLIDKDRTRRGDYFRKPTAFWFMGCKPTHGETRQPTPKEEVRTITAGSGALKTRQAKSKTMPRDELEKKFIDHKSKNGICDEDRSMISPDYARNFICDFILGKPSDAKPTQLDMFDMIEGVK